MSDIVHVIRATVNPSVAPTREGQHWVNTSTKQMWFSVGTSTVGDWILLSTAVSAMNKAGVVNAASFVGSPRKATVTFSTSAATPYAVNISGIDSRIWTVESMTTTGFVINSNAALGLTGDVFWEVQEDGEF